MQGYVVFFVHKLVTFNMLHVALRYKTKKKKKIRYTNSHADFFCDVFPFFPECLQSLKTRSCVMIAGTHVAH